MKYSRLAPIEKSTLSEKDRWILTEEDIKELGNDRSII